MIEFGINDLDLATMWSWLLLWMRFVGLLHTLPGIGTEEVPMFGRFTLSATLAFAGTIAGIEAVPANTPIEAVIMMISEFLLGLSIGFIPFFVVGAAQVAGQTAATAIGLAQANVIDPAIGQPITILARIQSLLATTVFLFLNGHHVALRATLFTTGEIGLGVLHPSMNTATLLIDRFSHSFELALVLCTPVIAAILLTQFTLGLLTKYIPQINIFIISLPLTIYVGMYIEIASSQGMIHQLSNAYYAIGEYTELLFAK